MCTFAPVMENRIKEVIKEQGYTMKDFAEKLGIARESLFKLIKNPSSPTLEKLSEKLNVPVWQFFASKQEVAEEIGEGQIIQCPKCGTKFKVKVTPEE